MTDLHLWLIPLVPFAGFLVNGLFGRKFPKALVTAVAIVAAAVPMLQVASIVYRFSSLAKPYIERTAHGSPPAPSAPTSLSSSISSRWSCCCVVTGVGFLIHVYSIGYMGEEEGYWRFFAYMNLFLFFMLTLVLAANFLLMFVGWEGVGLASYLLIGFYYTRDSAANAGKKAFLYNRVGDFGFLIAMFLLIAHFGSLDFSGVFAAIGADPAMHGGFLTAIGLLLLLGACGKSAQIPLYVWLPDAMEGPTPVSALIHAATMVTAGVYMIARAHIIFDRSAIALLDRRRHRHRHRALRRHHRHDADRHQARARLLHRLSARLHVPRLRSRRVLRRHLPSRHPRLLQGAALPRRRLRHPRPGRRAGHARHGRPAQKDSHHLLDHDRRGLRHLRIPAALRLLQQRRNSVPGFRLADSRRQSVSGPSASSPPGSPRSTCSASGT